MDIKFSMENPCGKCGTVGASVKWIKGEVGVVVSRETVKELEGMLRNCKVCGYSWTEEPLNKE